MPQTFIETESLSTPSLALPRQTRATIGVSRPQVGGKFLFRGEEKLYVRGVTYGTFRPNADGTDYPDPQQVEADFALMAANGINAVRTYLKNYFGSTLCTSTGYTKFTPAIRVKLLKGSLFFDIDHTAGTVGPTGLRPNTAWEMHPIQAISF